MAVTRAWILLVVLSACSTLVAFGGQAGLTVSVVILALAWAKALIILSRYLGLAGAPAWRRGFALALAAYMTLAMVLVAMAPGPL